MFLLQENRTKIFLTHNALTYAKKIIHFCGINLKVHT